MTGKWGPRPDVGVLYKDGFMKAIEMMSKTDKKSILEGRNINKISSEGLTGSVEIKEWAVWLNNLIHGSE